MKNGEAERLWKLQTRASELVLEGKREAGLLIEALQKFVFGSELGPVIWQEVYKILGLETEYAEFAEANSANDDQNLWIVPVIKGITPNKVVAALRELGVDVYTYYDGLDKAIVKNDRDPAQGSYMIGFAKNVEADKENKSKSADQLAKAGHNGVTLLERLLLELGYFLATGKHLDIENVTLCTGSRDRDGYVPYVGWDPDYREVYVDWDGPDGFSSDLRSRSAVSPAEATNGG